MGGHRPPSPPPSFTLIDAAKRDYILGRINFSEFDARIGQLLADGTGDDVGRLVPPPVLPATPTYRYR